jgi:ferredoxin--NADP+ reductase
MFTITETRLVGPDVKRFEIHAPRIAAKQRPGQFVILRLHEKGERIPLTIAGSDPKAGTITLVVQGIGKTTRLLNQLDAGDVIRDLVGPLGKPSEIKAFGHAVVVGGGVGTAIALPVARALKEAGNRVSAIIGARTESLLILLEEMRDASHDLHIMTDDGSAGDQGFVTGRLKELIDGPDSVNHVMAIGPIPMMAAVAEVTRPHGIHTLVSLNPIMVDGTGMCGGCRVQVGGEAKFACVDGPEFDAHAVDFANLSQRNSQYRHLEKQSLAKFQANPETDLIKMHHNCRLALLAKHAERHLGAA